MSISTNIREKDPALFAQTLFRVYLEDRDFSQTISMLHPEITWFGTGAHEIIMTYGDALRLLKEELASWEGHYKILDEWYETVPMDTEQTLVFGELRFREDRLDPIPVDMHIRFSLLCIKVADCWNALHVHFSVPNAAQKGDEFLPKGLAEKYNLVLEEKLLARTQMLHEKTKQLESLANNILGGVQICTMNADFTLEYTNEGFFRLTGYTPEEMKDEFENAYVPLIYPEDRSILRRALMSLTPLMPNFTVEYRMQHRDGTLIWVLANGTIFYEGNTPTHFQSILTDISIQKQQSEDLRMIEKRYHVALVQLDISMFEYNVLTKELIFSETDKDLYNVSTVIPNGPETLIQNGTILPKHAADYLEMYQKIHQGAAFASCFISTLDATQQVHEYELSLTAIFDIFEKPVRAIGVRKDVSQMRKLQREKKFGETMMPNKNLLFEADITNDMIIYTTNEWVEKGFYQRNQSYSSTILNIVDYYITPAQRSTILTFFAKEYIQEQYQLGERQIVFHYERLLENGKYKWYEATISIIKDERLGNISIRMYHVNIHERMQKEDHEKKERLLYESMIAKAILAYEFNLTQDFFINGHEDWTDTYGVPRVKKYSYLIKSFGEVAIHPEDAAGFHNAFSRRNALHAFSMGVKEIHGEYRKKNKWGKYLWIHCTMHLYESPENGDIKGYSYVEDIDKEKREALELKYRAEHDYMTNLWNKHATFQQMHHFLTQEENVRGIHAIFMIDVDHFKDINDDFGHIYGDKVLTEIASKINAVFDKDAIVGRVGGDEFCVLLQHMKSKETALEKAHSLCASIAHTYQRGTLSCFVSASVGIAFYPHNGSSYDVLFHYADEALYRAKKNGRNQFAY